MTKLPRKRGALCFSEHRQSRAKGCPNTPRGDRGLCEGAVDSLYWCWWERSTWDGHAASWAPHHSHGRGVGWQHNHGQENWDVQHLQSEQREREQRGGMASVIQQLDVLPKGKASAQSKGFSGTFLIAKSHMEPRASLLLLKTLTGTT